MRRSFRMPSRERPGLRHASGASELASTAMAASLTVTCTPTPCRFIQASYQATLSDQGMIRLRSHTAFGIPCNLYDNAKLQMRWKRAVARSGAQSHALHSTRTRMTQGRRPSTVSGSAPLAPSEQSRPRYLLSLVPMMRRPVEHGPLIPGRPTTITAMQATSIRSSPFSDPISHFWRLPSDGLDLDHCFIPWGLPAISNGSEAYSEQFPVVRRRFAGSAIAASQRRQESFGSTPQCEQQRAGISPRWRR